MRARGEDISPAIRAKLRDYIQSGVLQRPAGGGGGFGGGGGGAASRGSQPAVRSVYVLATNAPPDAVPQAVRVRTGISDGTTTEIVDGLNEGDTVILGLKYSQSAMALAPAGGASPFGGGGGGFGGRGGR
jgi:hypothetical protein